MSDVTFVFENTSDEGVANTFYGNRTILSLASPVFQTMLETSLPKAHDVIMMPTSEWMPFMTIMRFIYCDEVVIHPDHVVATLKAAEQYQIPEISFAVAALLDDDNIIDIVNYTHGTEAKRLAAPCVEYVRTNVTKLMTKGKFESLSPAAVKSIVSDSKLAADPLDLWDFCIAWSVAENRRRGIKTPTREDHRTVMADLIQDFKFEDMDADDLWEGPANILTTDEIKEIKREHHCNKSLARLKREREEREKRCTAFRAVAAAVTKHEMFRNVYDHLTIFGVVCFVLVALILMASQTTKLNDEVQQKNSDATVQKLRQEILWREESIMGLKYYNDKIQHLLKETEIERDGLLAAKGIFSF